MEMTNMYGDDRVSSGMLTTRLERASDTLEFVTQTWLPPLFIDKLTQFVKLHLC